MSHQLSAIDSEPRAVRVAKLIASLSRRQREVLRLYFRGDSYAAMGVALGMVDPGATMTAIRLKYRAVGLRLKGRGQGRGQNVLPAVVREGRKVGRPGGVPAGRADVPAGLRTEARTTNEEGCA
jgi:hypothetical protein